MTTFSFINVEASFSGGTSINHGEQTLYTVPAGKIAKIKFDSYHTSVDSTGNMLSTKYWVMYSQNTINSSTLRKHMMGSFDNNDSTVRSCSFYNPADFYGVQMQTGATTLYENRIMNAMPENWVSSNEPVNPNDSLRGQGTWNNQGLGAMTYGPETFFMDAGEVLKVRTKTVCNGSLTRYTNMRCAVWLEDA